MKKISIKTFYLIAVISIGLIGLAVGSTYAMFTASAEISDPISLSSNLTSNDDVMETFEVEIEPYKTVTRTININSDTIYNVNYTVWYLNDADDVDIGILSTNTRTTGTINTEELGIGTTCNIVLRNNRASEEHPDGIFHPHKELHHIKKENIGLIEVMGLAVLPGRLEKELDIIANILCGEISYNREKAQSNEEINKHIPWIEKMLSENLSLNYLEAKELIKKEVGIIFSRVLEDAGVFKRNEKGQEGFNKFLNKVI